MTAAEAVTRNCRAYRDGGAVQHWPQRCHNRHGQSSQSLIEYGTLRELEYLVVNVEQIQELAAAAIGDRRAERQRNRERQHPVQQHAAEIEADYLALSAANGLDDANLISLLGDDRGHGVGDQHHAHEERDHGQDFHHQNHPIQHLAAPVFVRLLKERGPDRDVFLGKAVLDFGGHGLGVGAVVRFDAHLQIEVRALGDSQTRQALRVHEEKGVTAEGGWLHERVPNQAGDRQPTTGSIGQLDLHFVADLNVEMLARQSFNPQRVLGRPIAGFQGDKVIKLVIVVGAGGDHAGLPTFIPTAFVAHRNLVGDVHRGDARNARQLVRHVLVDGLGEKHVDVRGVGGPMGAIHAAH